MEYQLRSKVHDHQLFVEQCSYLRYRAQKSLGQNFIIDEGIIHSTIDAAGVSDTDLILEIGPGTGRLTKPLLELARKVVGIELDPVLGFKLANFLDGFSNFTLLTEDARYTDYDDITRGDPYKIISNLPYYASNFFLRTFIELRNKPTLMVLMFQKEVADNVLAGPGSRRLISVITQSMCEVTKVCDVPKESFEPQPKIDSTVIKIIPKKDSFITLDNYSQFCDMLRAAFSSPRKTISNALSKSLNKPKSECIRVLTSCDIDPQRRSETLKLDEWRLLFDSSYADLFDSNV